MNSPAVRSSALGALLLFAATTASAAGLDLTWNACNQDGGAHDLAADCVSGGPYTLIGCFQVASPMAGITAMDIDLDFQVEGNTVVTPFWHFESGGCNETGLQISSDHAALPGTCNAISPWGTGDNSFLVSYGPGFSGGNRARMLASVVLPVRNPAGLVAGQNYYGFHLVIATTHAQEAGGACTGCLDKVAIVWNRCDLYDTGSSSPVILSGSGLVGECAGWNSPATATCTATPVRNTTWGALKAMYR